MSFESLSSGIELCMRETRTINTKITLSGSTTPTSVSCSSDTYDIIPYVEINGVQPSVGGTGLLYLQDSGANFPTLDSDADPTVWGLLLLVRDANPLFIPIVEFIYTAGGTHTVSRRGASTSGVTLSKNLAFSISSAGFDLSGNNTYTPELRITYKCFAST